MEMPKTLIEAIRYFSNEQTCINAVALLRWEDGSPVCPKCQAAQTGERNHYWLKTQQRWKCYQCRKQFSVKVGTIFEDSPIGLDKWLTALWLLVNCKNGVSSYEVSRDLGISQKAAWFVLQRLRHVLKDTTVIPMRGPVEADESFHGGKPKNMHRNRRLRLQVGGNGYSEKTAVFGMIDRETRKVRAQVVPNVKRDTLQKAILNGVGFGSTVYTDGWPGYDGLKASGFIHETVNHMNEYVRGQVHTQAIENFWSLLKRGLNGTYVAVEPYHMDRYLDEAMFRFNHRINHTDSSRFVQALSQVVNRRLTYAELTGKEAGSQA